MLIYFCLSKFHALDTIMSELKEIQNDFVKDTSTINCLKKSCTYSPSAVRQSRQLFDFVIYVMKELLKFGSWSGQLLKSSNKCKTLENVKHQKYCTLNDGDTLK